LPNRGRKIRGSASRPDRKLDTPRLGELFGRPNNSHGASIGDIQNALGSIGATSTLLRRALSASRRKAPRRLVSAPGELAFPHRVSSARGADRQAHWRA